MKNGEKRGEGKRKKEKKESNTAFNQNNWLKNFLQGGCRPPAPPCVNCMQLAHLLMEEKKIWVSLKTKKKVFLLF